MRDLIPRRIRFRLARHLPELADRGERGAIGVLVTILIGTGVLLGMGALVVDVGQLYQNRAELQNGADAAALAVAKSCVAGTCAASLATGYADANASALTGGTAYVNLVCGVNGSGTVGAGACTGTAKGCPANPAAGTDYVDVQTSTELPNGSHLLPPVFARTLAGNGNYQGTTVYACAQAEWGAPATAGTISVTISACTWDQATGGSTGQTPGTVFAQPPPYPPNSVPDASLDRVIYLHSTSGNGKTGNPDGCITEPAGADAPGNFGWTDDSGNCTVMISNNSYGGNTGTSVSQDCADTIYNDWVNKTVVYIPVYIDLIPGSNLVSGNGTNATYTLKGFAAFVITGFNLPGLKEHSLGSDWLNPDNNCSGSDFCINGYFTQGLIPSVGDLGGTNLGTDIIKLTG